MRSCGHRDAREPGRLRGGDAVRRIFDRERVAGLDAEPRARREIGVGRGLARDVAAGTSTTCANRCAQSEPIEVRDAPSRPASSTRSRTPSPARRPRRATPSTPGRATSRPRAARRGARAGAACIASTSTGRVARSTQPRLEVEATGGPDLGRPLLDRRGRGTVRLERRVPRREHGHLGVEDQPVEVEDDRSDRRAVTRSGSSAVGSIGSIGLAATRRRRRRRSDR